MHDAILRDVQELTAGAPQADDIKLLVIEFEGGLFGQDCFWFEERRDESLTS